MHFFTSLHIFIIIHINYILFQIAYKNSFPSRYLSLKASLLVPEMLEHLTKFHAMTAFWLIQINLHIVTEKDKQNFAPKQYIPVTFPLSETVPITLRYIKYTYIKSQ